MKMKFKDIAKGLHIVPSTAYRIYKTTGDAELKEKPRFRYDVQQKLDAHHELLIIGMLMQNPCMCLHEICNCIEEVSRLHVAGSTVCHTLQRNGYTRKQVQAIALERSTQYRGVYQANISHLATDHFVWVDETGSGARNHIRKFGYTLKGVTPMVPRLLARGRRVSAIAAISTSGLIRLELTMGTVNCDTFADFVCGTLIPEMEPFDGSVKKSVIIMDNGSIHHVNEVIDEAGITAVFLASI